jgi:hypothetical protein
LEAIGGVEGGVAKRTTARLDGRGAGRAGSTVVTQKAVAGALALFGQCRCYDEGMKLQRQYVMEETALSLFMTEVYGHNLEVYRRGLGFVDYLYSDRPTTLTLITGKSQLNRRFIAIEDWLRPENQDPSRKRLPS